MYVTQHSCEERLNVCCRYLCLHATATPPATRFVCLPTRDTATKHVVHCSSKLRLLPVSDPQQYMRVFNSLSTMLAML